MSAFQNMEVDYVDTTHAVCPVCRRPCRGHGDDPVTFHCGYCGKHEYTYTFLVWALEERLSGRWPTAAQLAPFVARWRTCPTWDVQPSNFKAMVRHCSALQFSAGRQVVLRLHELYGMDRFAFPVRSEKDVALDLMGVSGSPDVDELAELLQRLSSGNPAVIAAQSAPPGWFGGRLTEFGRSVFFPIIRSS